MQNEQDEEKTEDEETDTPELIIYDTDEGEEIRVDGEIKEQQTIEEITLYDTNEGEELIITIHEETASNNKDEEVVSETIT